MKKIVIMMIVGMASLHAAKDPVPKSAFLIDTIQAVVFGSDGVQVIPYSDVIRPSLSGAPRTLDDLVFERLVYLDAQRFKILADDEAVDKYLATVQKDNNLSQDDIKKIFAQAGYSYQEGRDQFKMLQTVNSMLDFKIRSHVIVPRHLVQEYYDAHPVQEQAAYQIQIGFLSAIAGQEDKQIKAIAHMAKSGKAMKDIDWGQPFWVAQEDVAEDKAFIFNLKVGQTSLAQPVEGGFQIFKLVAKKESRIVPLDERYREIADILRRPIYDRLMDEYKKQLFATASVLYLI